ncbi:MAG TPA: serine hydrolase domain-containing protein [Bacteroidota bacterium]|nr:serine hydrolase domain-containing protein [Bacteroidota bacterium]
MANLFFYAYFLSALCFHHTGEPAGISPVTPSTMYPDRTQNRIAERFDSLFAILSSQRGFNGNVLVSHNGKVLYKHAFGYSDLRRRTPLSIESEFQLASVSKQFTSVAVMILHDQQKVNFSDTLQKYFPDFPYQHITIRELLTHRSGLPDYMSFAAKYRDKHQEYISNADVMDMLTRYTPKAEFLPDQRYCYSNTGYAVLAALVEKVSGMRFDEFMQQHVFTPLGMHNTYVFNPNVTRPVLPGRTIGHDKNRRPVFEDFLGGVVGDKGIYSTVEDMFKWDQALYTEALVRQSTLEEAFTPISHDYRHNTNYGYGWRIKEMDGGSKIIYHAGWWRGYNSLYVRRREDKTSIIVLSNKVNWSFRNIGTMFNLIDSPDINVTAMGGD